MLACQRRQRADHAAGALDMTQLRAVGTQQAAGHHTTQDDVDAVRAATPLGGAPEHLAPGVLCRDSDRAGLGRVG